jgi:hypothetical protein
MDSICYEMNQYCIISCLYEVPKHLIMQINFLLFKIKPTPNHQRRYRKNDLFKH